MSLTTTVTTVQQVKIEPKIARKLMVELDGYHAVSSEIKALSEAKTGHSDAVLALALEGVDGDKFDIGNYKVAVVKGARDRRLNKEAVIKRLIADGKYSMKAAIALIEDCTTDSPKRDHVRISLKGGKDETE